MLTAARGDCRVSVRRGSPDGSVIYEGTLLSSRSLRLDGERLGVRFGAAANLDLTLNGRKIAALPAGTVDVVATAEGIQPASESSATVRACHFRSADQKWGSAATLRRQVSP